MQIDKKEVEIEQKPPRFEIKKVRHYFYDHVLHVYQICHKAK